MIIFSDFDNTLYRHGDPATTAENFQAVKKFRQAGHKFCLATGRSLSSIENAFSTDNLPNYRQCFDYLVLDNGAICMRPNGEVILEELIPQATAQKIYASIVQKYDKNHDFQLVAYYGSSEHPEIGASLTKMRLWNRNNALAIQITDEINQRFGNEVKAFAAYDVIPTRIPWLEDGDFTAFIDIAPVKAGKENTIARLVQQSFPSEKVITVGDDTNDISMIRQFDGYAVANAVPLVLENTSTGHIVNNVAALIEWLLN